MTGKWNFNIVAIGILATSLARADDWKPIPRVLPPVGIKIADGDREKIASQSHALAERIEHCLTIRNWPTFCLT